ncbi:MAG: c-type cytochrome domain-containing protein [Bdellovibrionales bacterium]
MFAYQRISWLVVATSLIGCAEALHSKMEGDAVPGNGATAESMLAAFKTTLHPVLTTNCGSCHGASQPPFHAVADAGFAMDAILNSALVNFSNPGASKLVMKIRAGHNGIPTVVADDIEGQIVEWVTQSAGPGQPPALPTPPPLTASFKSIYDRVLIPKCVGCHTTGNADGGVRLDDFTQVSKYVKPGQPNQSKLVTICASGEMPPSGTDDLTSEELKVVKDWITAGAANN